MPIEEITIGTTILVRHGEVLPLDGNFAVSGPWWSATCCIPSQVTRGAPQSRCLPLSAARDAVCHVVGARCGSHPSRREPVVRRHRCELAPPGRNSP